jgi:hypothetical protein
MAFAYLFHLAIPSHFPLSIIKVSFSTLGNTHKPIEASWEMLRAHGAALRARPGFRLPDGDSMNDTYEYKLLSDTRLAGYRLPELGNTYTNFRIIDCSPLRTRRALANGIPTFPSIQDAINTHANSRFAFIAHPSHPGPHYSPSPFFCYQRELSHTRGI